MTDFDLSKEYTLEDDAVLLRPLRADDYEHLLPFALDEPEIWKFSLFPAAGEEGLKSYIDTALASKAAGTEYPFIVFDKRTGKYAGSTRFYDIQLNNRSLQLGYTWYGKAFQGTGLNKHCKLLLLQLAFDEFNLLRVEFRADNNNAKSIAAMKSIGCTEEGVLRSHVATSTGARRNSIILSILKDEWDAGIKEKLIQKISLL
jgi:RimJ/RimL family protein N-acetyltransferase